MKTVYIEKNIQNHPRVERILSRLGSSIDVILCEHYGEVFNPKAQNFRLQKQNPAIILAEKKGKFILPTPEDFGIGGEQNYYFSHMLNCLFDCRYCFLQGMYNSANYVLFINYEDFMEAISLKIVTQNKPVYFFSGYDCDSLAFEPVTHFIQEFMPFFEKNPQAILELRTKSTNINTLLNCTPIDNCIIAFSFTPEIFSQAFEHKVASVAKRISAMSALAKAGWKMGLRFDPLIYHEDFNALYQELIDAILMAVDTQQIHSVSVGPLRFPVKMYHKLVKLYPKEKLLAHPLHKHDKIMTYSIERENKMQDFVLNYLKTYFNQTLIFTCYNI